MTKTLLSIGHGYSARALGRRLVADGWRVIGTTRSAEKAEALRRDEVEPLIWPGADLAPAITEATHILTSVAPGEAGDSVLEAAGPALRAASPEWVGYLSTIGVYGDRQGDWIDESADLRPSTKRGEARVEAEAAWAALGQPLHIFRLAGIYGPGRGPFSKVRKGTARRIIKEGQVFSRIHVEDIATVLAASIARPRPGAIYNVCDNEPAPPQDVIAHAAQLLGLPVPPAIPFEEAEMSPMARSFYSESKRCSNARIREELGVTMAYPGYRAGLAALLDD
ncbi:nucleoside-diphosphate-sugar epimerase [Rubricella aquisinus]|uniref:Nucleoside-diphosphate-sugar epimerase n=1 Tax=Rubricella aquisinus TaxID=2028108 RepID=A0A840WJD9_9RHOB|nr:SDR family oxidoreductase [Rubricella aquisinus]MBB5514631.1 nucleoside-diphosphate-sugar epimerase [Rubricella aquisinus]